MPTSRHPDHPLRISIVHPWDPWKRGIGGFDTFLDGFLRYAPSDWRLELIGTTADPERRPVGRWVKADYAGRPVSHFPALAVSDPNQVGTVPLSLRFAWAARRFLPTISGDLVVFHRFESRFGVRIKSGDRKLVFYLHNHPQELKTRHSGNRWNWFGPLFEVASTRTLRQADLLVAVDPRTPAWIERRMPGWRGLVLSQQQWADPEIFHPPPADQRAAIRRKFRERYAFDVDLPLLAFAGRIEKQKDPLLMLDVLEQAAARVGSLGMVIVGEGRLKAVFQREVEARGLTGTVRLIPPVSQRELAGIFHACDVGLCTSWYEAGPRQVFESLASGMPVVSFDVGQVDQVLDADCRTGFLVTERSVGNIIQGVACVLAIPTTDERARKCAERVADFTPQAALRPILAAYERIAGRTEHADP